MPKIEPRKARMRTMVSPLSLRMRMDSPSNFALGLPSEGAVPLHELGRCRFSGVREPPPRSCSARRRSGPSYSQTNDLLNKHISRPDLQIKLFPLEVGAVDRASDTDGLARWPPPPLVRLSYSPHSVVALVLCRCELKDWANVILRVGAAGVLHAVIVFFVGRVRICHVIRGGCAGPSRPSVGLIFSIDLCFDFGPAGARFPYGIPQSAAETFFCQPRRRLRAFVPQRPGRGPAQRLACSFRLPCCSGHIPSPSNALLDQEFNWPREYPTGAIAAAIATICERRR